MNRSSARTRGHDTRPSLAMIAADRPRTLPDGLPSIGVGAYVERLAQLHGIDATPERLDSWAEAVTRAAGDEVRLDRIGQLLVALKRRHVIDGRLMARLLASHLLEGSPRGVVRASTPDDAVPRGTEPRSARGPRRG